MWFPALGAFLRFANDHIITVGAGNGTANKQNIVAITHLNHFQILGRAPHLAHVTWHSHPAHNGAWEKALTDGPGAAMPSFSAVRGIAAAKTMPFDNPFETAPFRHA